MNRDTTYKLLIAISGLILMIFSISSCNKDLGNYKYGEINQVLFSGLDTANGYNVNLGEVLHISPTIKATMDQNMSGSYTYEWKVRNNLFGTAAPGYNEIVLSTTKDLDYLINFPPGRYGISVSVTDEKTGVSWLQAVPITVTTPYYQGWLVLNEVSDTTRMDFITYLDDEFTVNKNVLGLLNPGMPTLGKPYQIAFFDTWSFYESAGIYLLTESGANNLDLENFRFSEDKDVVEKMLGSPPQGFTMESLYLTKSPAGNAYYDFFMYADKNIYRQQYGSFMYGAPINTSGLTGQTFPVSPYMVNSGANLITSNILFNTDERRFYSYQTYYFDPAIPVDASLNFPTGKDVVYMYDNDVFPEFGTNYAYAIMKDPGIDKYYMFRFSFINATIQPRDYFEEITATDFAQAEHYAISPNLGYLFYSVGGKVYEYDLFLKSSKLVLDKGNEEISLLEFDVNKKPDQYKNSLMVGSYDPAGTPGENGTLAQYAVLPVNAGLSEQNKWTGLGKIVSISYRYR